jgi:BMFP domain-containing protein YqiC
MTEKELLLKLEELDKRIEGTLKQPITRGAREVNAKCHQLKQKYLNKLNKLKK